MVFHFSYNLYFRGKWIYAQFDIVFYRCVIQAASLSCKVFGFVRFLKRCYLFPNGIEIQMESMPGISNDLHINITDSTKPVTAVPRKTKVGETTTQTVIELIQSQAQRVAPR
jgi:hypothetical protein